MNLSVIMAEVQFITVLLKKKHSEVKQLILYHPASQIPDVSGPIQYCVYRITIVLIALVILDENG